MKTAIPGAYPMPGSYTVDYMSVYLGSATPNAKVYYTLDGSEPTFDSKVFYPEKVGCIPILSFCEAAPNGIKEVTVKAFAAADGMEPSRVVTFNYRFFIASPGTYSYELLREGTAETPALFRINDYCRSNMFLIVGSESAMLVDGGIDKNSEILPFVNELTGGLPVSNFITHGHGDHNAVAKEFIDHNCKVYVSNLDIPTFKMGGFGEAPAGTLDVQDGDCYDLGNTKLYAYFLPGHTPGGFVLLDEKTGDLFASDALVNNDPWGPNSALLGLGGPDSAIECYYERFVALRKKLAGRAKRVWTGHNTFSHDAEMFFDKIEFTMKDALDRGEAAIVPHNRPSRGINAMIANGDYKTDFCSVAISLRYLYREDALNDHPVKGFEIG